MEKQKEKIADIMMHLPLAYRDSRLLRVVLLLRRVIVPLSPLCLIALVSPNLRGIEVGGIARHLQMFGFAFFGAALLTPGIGWLSRRVGALDHPDPRKKHAVATPVLGAAWRCSSPISPRRRCGRSSRGR